MKESITQHYSSHTITSEFRQNGQHSLRPEYYMQHLARRSNEEWAGRNLYDPSKLSSLYDETIHMNLRKTQGEYVSYIKSGAKYLWEYKGESLIPDAFAKVSEEKRDGSVLQRLFSSPNLNFAAFVPDDFEENDYNSHFARLAYTAINMSPDSKFVTSQIFAGHRGESTLKEFGFVRTGGELTARYNLGQPIEQVRYVGKLAVVRTNLERFLQVQ